MTNVPHHILYVYGLLNQGGANRIMNGKVEAWVVQNNNNNRRLKLFTFKSSQVQDSRNTTPRTLQKEGGDGEAGGETG